MARLDCPTVKDLLQDRFNQDIATQGAKSSSRLDLLEAQMEYTRANLVLAGQAATLEDCKAILATNFLSSDFPT